MTASPTHKEGDGELVDADEGQKNDGHGAGAL
jgi:hypothetical protein